MLTTLLFLVMEVAQKGYFLDKTIDIIHICLATRDDICSLRMIKIKQVEPERNLTLGSD